MKYYTKYFKKYYVIKPYQMEILGNKEFKVNTRKLYSSEQQKIRF